MKAPDSKISINKISYYIQQFQLCLEVSTIISISITYLLRYHVLKKKYFLTQKLIKLAFTINKCCALSTIAKVSTYFPILMIGGRRGNAFFYVNYQKSRKLSQAYQRVKYREGKTQIFFSGPDCQGRYFGRIFLGSQKFSQMAAYVC